MNPEIKTQWLTALRSGDYKQGDGFLKITEDYGDGVTETRHCCLGVLCDLAADAGIVKRSTPEEADNSKAWEFGEHYPETEGLPDEVQKWAGIDTNLGDFDGPVPMDGYDVTDLATLNDKGMTFAEIADVIEKRF